MILYLLQVAVPRNLTSTEFKQKFAETPRVHCKKLALIHVPKFWLDTHGYHIYPNPGNSRVHTCILQSSDQINTESKNLQPELFRGKTCVGIYSQTVCDSRKSEGKTEGLQEWAGPKSSINLVILVRIPPNFLYKSRVLHLVCTPMVYMQENRPRSSCFFAFLFNTYVDNYEWRWKLCLCSTQEFYFKKLVT